MSDYTQDQVETVQNAEFPLDSQRRAIDLMLAMRKESNLYQIGVATLLLKHVLAFTSPDADIAAQNLDELVKTIKSDLPNSMAKMWTARKASDMILSGDPLGAINEMFKALERTATPSADMEDIKNV